MAYVSIPVVQAPRYGNIVKASVRNSQGTDARDGRTLSQSENDWEKSCCGASTKLAIVKKLYVEAKSAAATAIMSPIHIPFFQILCGSQYIDSRLFQPAERILDTMHLNILPQIDHVVT